MHDSTKAVGFTFIRAFAVLLRASSSSVLSSRSRAVARPASLQTRQLESPQSALSAPFHLADEISHIFSLNDEQRAALCCDEQHIRLRAGPGSGKTRSAAAYALLAMARARQQGTDKNVLAITFTNNATEEFAKRVKENAAEVGLDKQPHVSTIHGLCAGILGFYKKQLGGGEHLIIATEHTKQQVMEEVLRNSGQWDMKTLQQSHVSLMVKTMVQTISNVKTHVEHIYDSSGKLRRSGSLIPCDMSKAGMDIVPNDVVTTGSTARHGVLDPDYIRPQLATFYDEYNKQMAQRGLVDFDDLLHLTLRLLEQNSQVGTELRARYHTIIVDEAQDLNKCQHAILRLLTDTTTRTFRVGDPDQCIFQFAGADPRAWLEGTFNGQPVKELVLIKNHRSTDSIVKVGDCAKKVTRRDETCGKCLSPVLKHFQPGEAVRADPANYDQPAKLMGFRTARQEVQAVVDLVKNSLLSTPEGRVAVLYTGRSDTVTAIGEALKAEGIPVTFDDDNNFLQLNEVKAADALLRLVVDPDNADLHLRGLIDVCQQQGWVLPLLKELDGSTCNELKQLLLVASSNGQRSGRTATLAGQLYSNIDHARAADVAKWMLVDEAQQKLYPLQKYLASAGLIEDEELRCITTRGTLDLCNVAAVQRLWAFVTLIRAAANNQSSQAAVQLALSASGLTAAVASGFGGGALTDDTSTSDRLDNLKAYIAAGTDDQHSSDSSGTAVDFNGKSPTGLDQLAQFHQRIMLKSRTSGRLGSSRVQMTTVHKAKGCEWDVVILVDACSLRLFDGTPETERQQKCNQLTVAVSRAKDQLFVTWNTEFGNTKGKHAAMRTAIASASVGNAVDSNGVKQDQDAVYDGTSGTPTGDGSSQARQQGGSGGALTSRKSGYPIRLIPLLCDELSKSCIKGVEVVASPSR